MGRSDRRTKNDKWYGPSAQEVPVILRELFEHQAELNRRIGFDPDQLRENFNPQQAGVWLNNYIAAMSNELEELRDGSYWKHRCSEGKRAAIP